MMTLSELIQKSAQKQAHQPAFFFKDQSLSYAKFYDATLKVASGLKAAGIRPGDKVLLLLKNSPEFAFTVFGLSHIGAVAVPVNFLLKTDEISFICANAGVAAAVTQSVFLDSLLQVQQKCATLKNIWVTDGKSEQRPGRSSYSELLDHDPVQEIVPKPDQTVLILYTSGTSGKPKGAMLSHANLTTNAEACVQHLDLNSKDRFMCILPMFHVFAWTTNILVPLLLGSPTVLIESIRPPKPWLQQMSKYGITIFAAVPQIYLHLAEQAVGLKKWALRFLFFRKVRMAISGAAPLPLETLKRFEESFHVPLLEGYGLTETGPVVSANSRKAKRAGSVGKVLPGVEVKLIDENGNTSPEGKEGEICIRGPNVIQGYYGLPEENKNSFTKDGWFRTGDIGSIDTDGFLYIRDRIKDMIIVKGLKIFSIQVEEALLEHPAVAEAAVVGIPNSSGDETVKAFIVLKDGQSADKLELLKYCQEKLPPYKRPKEIEIRKELPKNALQKVLKRELRKGG